MLMRDFILNFLKKSGINTKLLKPSDADKKKMDYLHNLKPNMSKEDEENLRKWSI